MGVISCIDISCRFDDGVTLFSGINLELDREPVALVGPNGQGKSTLGQMIAGEMHPSAGHVRSTVPVRRLAQDDASAGGTVRQLIDPMAITSALNRLDRGDGTAADVSLIGENWSLREELIREFATAGVPFDLDASVDRLSGGERMRLRLAALFRRGDAYLVLDEPSNHLDRQGRDWLMQKIFMHPGGVLVITHDRGILHRVGRIHELDQGRVQTYHGDYSHYRQEKDREIERADADLRRAERDAAERERERRKSVERAARRSRAGKKDRARGSQPKSATDFLKGRAEAGASARVSMQEKRKDDADRNVRDAKGAVFTAKPLSFIMNEPSGRGGGVRVESVRLPYGTTRPVSLVVGHSSRIRLAGANGSGKSTLLAVIAGKIPPVSGRIVRFGRCVMVDQHASMLRDDESAFDAYRRLMPGMSDEDYRQGLAGLHLRGDRALLKTRNLSGGERMKLALTVAVNGPSAADVLLLDEPDTHIDLDSLRVMEQALKDYSGAFVLVSHDEAFVSTAGVTETVWL